MLENRHKALIFSQFVDHLTIVREYLERQGITYQYLDGATSGKERKNRVDAFQAGEGDIFLISLKAGGTGLNLTVTDYVIHLDPWRNPAAEDQASDRAHRIGQLRSFAGHAGSDRPAAGQSRLAAWRLGGLDARPRQLLCPLVDPAEAIPRIGITRALKAADVR